MRAAEVAPAARPTHRRYILLLLVFLHTLNTYMDRVCISAAARDIKTDLGLSDQMMGHVFGIFALGYALCQIPAGWLADRFGARRVLTGVVGLWSAFTALTGFAASAGSLLAIRFLFGVGEAGAFPGATRALYGWLPARERGIAQGIFHSGARVGAALSLFLLPWLILALGWRMTFVVTGATGVIWAAVWCVWYRDDPATHHGVNTAELNLIRSDAAAETVRQSARPSLGRLLTSSNLLLAMFQYAASNVTFFISFTWLLPYLQNRWGPETAKLAPVPLLFGMTAQWCSGWMVSVLHRRGAHVASRRVPAMLGFAISALGLVLCTLTAPESPGAFILCFGVAIFGAEMTISPSWAFCMDIGGIHAGAVSGAMNMVGNLGSALGAILFPWFVAHVTLPLVARQAGSANSFFICAALLNLLAVGAWLLMNPQRDESASGVRSRNALIVGLLVVATAVVFGVRFFSS